MYLHQVSRSGSSTALLHYREKHAPSGLIESIINIGQTVAVMDAPTAEPRILSSGLIMPTPQQVAYTEHKRADAGEQQAETVNLPEEIRCDNLAEFVQKGVAKWMDLVAMVPGIRKVDAHPIEINKTTETATASGLVLPGQPVREFDRYVATIEEIEAMERIAIGVSLLQPPKDHPSPYL